MDTANLERPIILATGSKLHNRVLQCYQKKATIILVQEPNELFQILLDNGKATLLLDLSLFNDDVDHPTVKTIFKKGVEQQIIVVTNEQDPSKLCNLLEQGALGFCQPTISDELLMKMIKVVDEGELWIGRKIVSYLTSTKIQNRTRKKDGALDQRLSNFPLTEREHEIAFGVAQGKCNKVIARDLDISLSMVKTHLGHIFTKLQITGRIQLALNYSEI